MTDEDELRTMARKALVGQRIPVRTGDRMWGGPGHGGPCSLCGVVLSREIIGLEVEFRADVPGSPPSTHQFHVLCFAAWEAERRASVDGPDLRGGDPVSATHGHPPILPADGDGSNGLRPHPGDGTIPDRERDRIESEDPR